LRLDVSAIYSPKAHAFKERTGSWFVKQELSK
jgi:hypothetical protein